MIIVNHHLFFADMAIKLRSQGGAGRGSVAGRGGEVIFDEAHELEDVASSYFGITLSNVHLEELVRDVDAMLKAKNALSTG